MESSRPEPLHRRLFNLAATTVDYGPLENSLVSTAPNLCTNRFGVGTWNVRGCVRDTARDKIDEFLHRKGINLYSFGWCCFVYSLYFYNTGMDLVFLQETHLISGESLTTHFRWYNSGGKGAKTARGVSVLVRVPSNIEVRSWHSISDSLTGIFWSLTRIN